MELRRRRIAGFGTHRSRRHRVHGLQLRDGLRAECFTGRVVAQVDTQSPIAATDEQNAVQRTSLAVGDGLLLVPAGTTLFAY